MQATGKIYTGTVVEENGELMIQFPFELITELNWKEGDTIVWDIDEENKIIIAKKDNA